MKKYGIYSFQLNLGLLGCFKAPGLRDRKRHCIVLILCLLRSLNRGSFQASPKFQYSTGRSIDLLFSSKANYARGLIFVFLFFLTGCAYRFGRGELSEQYRTISIPYVKGDQRGELTADIIKQLSVSGAFQYQSHQGDLTLKVELLEFREENVEFRYDRKKTGKLKHSIIPTETRVSCIAEVLLIESTTGKTLKGPTRISASADFDHTFYATRNEVNIFSLGQLNDFDAARDAVMHPLNRNLAEKIVDYVINSW